MLEKTYIRSFKSEEEGDRIIGQIEAQLRLGIHPPDIKGDAEKYTLIKDVIRGYLRGQPLVSDQDKRLLGVLMNRIGHTRVTAIDYQWVERWISGMKTTMNLKPGTIRHHVGALRTLLQLGE